MAYTSFSFGLLFWREASHHVKRRLSNLLDKKLRPPAKSQQHEQAILEVNPPTPLKPSDDYSPGQYLDGNLWAVMSQKDSAELFANYIISHKLCETISIVVKPRTFRIICYATIGS